jgi:hypothetical protein
MPHKSKKTHETTTFTLSHSSLETMTKCPHQWYLKYVKQLYPEKDNDVTDFGNLCHEIAENYYGGGRLEIKRLYKEISPKYILTPEYAKKLPLAMKRLEVFYNEKLEKSPKVYHEKEFRFALDEYIDVTGKVDVMYKEEDGTWVVVDYKTSKKMGNYFDQFAFYYFLITRISGKIPDKLKFQGVYFCAGSGIELDDFVDEVILEKDAIEVAENRIGNGINTILHHNVDNIEKWKKKPSPLCSWCEYQNAGICEGNGKGKRVK